MTRVTVAACGIALFVAAGIGHFLLGLPIQVSDSFGHMLELSRSWSDLLQARLTQPGFLRPLHWASLKLVFDLSGGDYFTWFRGLHVLQVTALALLFIALVRPRTWSEMAILPPALAVLVGVHTSAGLMREAYPINHYLTVAICSVAAAVLVLARHRWWNDVLVVLLFLVATLTIETGLLVWVVAIGGVLLGGRGISRGGVSALVLLLIGYVYARFAVLGVGSPDLMERSSGFGFGVIDPPELVARFGGNPLPFYLYNVVASMLSVLLSEPTAGVFRVTQRAASGSVPPFMIVNVLASAGVVVLLAAFARRRWPDWTARRFERDDRLVLLFGMVLVANAVISYPYTKDVIMSPAGIFLAAAAFGAARHFIPDLTRPMTRVHAAAVLVAVVAVSSAWSLRFVGLHTRLRHGAVVERLDWAYIEQEMGQARLSAHDARERSLMEALKHEALVRRPAPPPLRVPGQHWMGE